MDTLSERIDRLSPEKKALLKQMLLKKKQAASQAVPRASRKERLPLSYAQERLWFFHRMTPESPVYNLSTALLLEGEPDVPALEKSLNAIIQRHEILRTRFIEKDGQPELDIMEEASLSVHIGTPADDRIQDQEAEIRKRLTEQTLKPFDLSRAPLIRVSIIPLSFQKQALLLTMHHIISDGWSMGIFIDELKKYYEAFINNRSAVLPEIPVQYADFAVWQRQWLKQGEMERQLKYWEKHLEGVPPVIDLPIDYPRPAETVHSGAEAAFSIDASLADRLRELGRKNGATLFMVLLGAYSVFLSRYTGAKDIVIGTPVAGRNRKETEPLIGLFVNMLPLRVQLSGDADFTELLKQARETATAGFSRQDIPFEELVNRLKPERSLNHHPVYQAVFVMHNTPQPPLALPGLTITPVQTETVSSQVDLILSVQEISGGLFCKFEYCTALFKQETAKRFAANFTTLLYGIAETPHLKLNELPLIAKQEMEKIIHGFNRLNEPFPENLTFPDLFERQAAGQPERPAVFYDGKTTDYGELNRTANRIAHYLTGEGSIRREEPVGLMLEASASYIAALLGILKAGGVYVPLPPDYPPERIRFMMKDSKCRILISENRFLDAVETLGSDAAVINMDAPPDTPDHNPEAVSSPLDSAYIIYTSGSTGRPKGVPIQHRSMVNFITWYNDAFRVTRTSRSTMYMNTGFDASGCELWPFLAVGGQVFPVPSEYKLNMDALADFIRRRRITHTILPTSVFELFIENDLQGIDPEFCLLTGGEALKKIRPLPFRFYNCYGPTEVTIMSTSGPVPEDGSGPITIGKPISNVQILMLDEHMNPVPIGAWGEMCIGGVQVSPGYLNREALNKETFVSHPLAADGRLYRTGDLARWLPDGQIEFLGRRDHQVKIRGYRIELGEIENRLQSHPDILQAAVILHENDTVSKSLICYYAGDNKIETESLVNHLRRHLPEYMMPSRFIHMDRLPLTANGKTDKAALPPPEDLKEGRQAFVPPASKQEKAVADVWKKLLRQSAVSADDNYFELGGDSINAIRMISMLRSAGWDMDIRDIFKYPTPAALAPHLIPFSPSETTEEAHGIVPLTPVQHWFFQETDTDRHHFNQAALLICRSRLDKTVLKNVISSLHRHHDALRLVYRFDGGDVIQAYNENPPAPFFDFMDLTGSPHEDENAGYDAMRRHMDALHRSMNLEKGPLFKAVLYRLKDADRLFVTFHHLVGDAFSTMILIEDIDTGYEQAKSGGQICLSETSDTYKKWAEAVAAYAADDDLLKERDYWRSIAEAPPMILPSDKAGGDNRNCNAGSVAVSLTLEETERLLSFASKSESASPSDLLTAALAVTVSQWTGSKNIELLLVGHGRHPLNKETDVGRTAGWFSIMYPARISLKNAAEPAELAASVSKQLDSVPNHGRGYSILKYLGKDPALQNARWPEIIFNYISQFDGIMNLNCFSGAEPVRGELYSPAHKRTTALDISAMILESQLHLFITYDGSRFYEKTISGFGEKYVEMIRTMIA